MQRSLRPAERCPGAKPELQALLDASSSFQCRDLQPIRGAHEPKVGKSLVPR